MVLKLFSVRLMLRLCKCCSIVNVLLMFMIIDLVSFSFRLVVFMLVLLRILVRVLKNFGCLSCFIDRFIDIMGRLKLLLCYCMI